MNLPKERLTHAQEDKLINFICTYPGQEEYEARQKAMVSLRVAACSPPGADINPTKK